MLQFICGGSYSKREEVFFETVKNAARSRKDVICIIPDQYSFEFDRKLYDALGVRLFNNVTTIGFNRLSEMLAAKFGGAAQSCDDHIKTILMFRAIKALSKKGNVRFYKKNLDKPAFIGECLELVQSLRESGITPEMLKASAESHGGVLEAKLSDLSEIYKNFMEELDTNEMTDSLSALARACDQAERNSYFKGKSVFISSFTSFTHDELRMCDIALSQCEEMTVSLVIDDNCVGRYHTHPFHDTLVTKQKLTELANNHGVDVRTENCAPIGGVSEELVHLSENLYSYSDKAYPDYRELENKLENEEISRAEAEKKLKVRLVSSSDMFEESEYICSEIMRLVREEKYNFSEIAVVVRDLDQIAEAFEDSCERYDIPLFVDRSENAENSLIVRYIVLLMKCLMSRKYSTDSIMKLIKSDLYPMSYSEVNTLEKYCFVWGVDKDMWLSDFTAPDRELRETDDPEIQKKQQEALAERMKTLNELRKRVIEPFEAFKKAIGAEPTAASISTALYDLFIAIGLSKKAYHYFKNVEACENNADASDNKNKNVELLRGLKQLWGNVMSVITSIYQFVGNERISLRRYSELFRIITSQIKVSKPPQQLNCVILCDASRSRIGSVKAVFAAEMNDGIFPASVQSGALVTEHEKQLLGKDGMIIGQSARAQFFNEKLNCYTALTSATDRLYALYSCADLLGTAKRPSSLAGEIKDMFGSIVCVNTVKLSADSFVSSYKSAYYKYLENIASKDSVSETLRAFLENSSEYGKKLPKPSDIYKKPEFKMSSELAEETFFPQSLTHISPTQLDTYFKCPFSYYCHYGLSLSKPDKKEIGKADRGLIVHELFEKLMKHDPDKEGYGKAAVKMNDEELRQFVDECVDDYISRKLGGGYGKPEDFDYRVEKLKEFAFDAAEFVRDELGGSKFRPTLIEYKLSPEKGLLEIDAGNGRKIVLTGYIDRADIFEANDKTYIRIIDYKTGTQTTFDYGKLYLGLNLQMLVYLTGLLEADETFKDKKDSLAQAGIVYFIMGKAPDPVNQSSNNSTDLTKAENALLKSFKPEGRTVLDTNVLDAYNSDSGYAYAPHKVTKPKKKGEQPGYSESIISDKEFTALRTFAKDKVASFGHRLSDGEIDAKPLDETCTYCDYADICGLVNRDDAVKTKDNRYKDLMKEELKRLMREGDSNE